MKPFAPELSALIRGYQKEIFGFVTAEAQPAGDQPASPTTEADVGQMMVGFFRVVFEDLEERGRAIRDSQLETLIPGLRDSGLPLDMVVGGTARLLVGMAATLMPRVSEAQRPAAATWFADFANGYVSDLLRAWEAAR